MHGVCKQLCNEGESHDRNNHLESAGQLGLPGSQQALVEAVRGRGHLAFPSSLAPVPPRAKTN